MIDADHYRKLEHLYAAAPISRWYGISIAVLALPSTALGGWVFTGLSR